MSKISVTEAEKLVSVGKSTIYADIETGKLSFEINARGHKVIDPAELDRVYGLVNMPEPNGNGGNGIGSETGNHRKLLETAGSQMETIGKSRKRLKPATKARLTWLFYTARLRDWNPNSKLLESEKRHSKHVTINSLRCSRSNRNRRGC